jgi:hypothetical protein
MVEESSPRNTDPGRERKPGKCRQCGCPHYQPGADGKCQNTDTHDGHSQCGHSKAMHNL